MICKCGCGEELTGNQKMWHSKACFGRAERARKGKAVLSNRVCQCGRESCQRILTGNMNNKYATDECKNYVRYAGKNRLVIRPKLEKKQDAYVMRDGERIRQASENYSKIIATPGANYAENQKRKTLEMRDANRHK